MAETTKVGIIACSGEEIPAGTLSRVAARRVLELVRPQSTVTLCLPLFLAGEEQERRFARHHPTITVDGCDKLCAKRGTQQHSGQVAASLVVTDILGDRIGRCHRSARDFDKSDEEAVWILAEKIAAQVDALLRAAPAEQPSDTPKAASCGCSCARPPPEGSLKLTGKTVNVNGLPLIFDHLFKQDLKPGNGCADRLLETVRMYHEIPDGEDGLYRDALAIAYQEYYERRIK
jgi:uncharacterized metal-binding protein